METLTVEDILNAQERQKKNIDPKKNCETCGSKKIKCDSCFNSFIGIPFNPSNWKEKDKEKVNGN
jgi:hypothetical protein